MYIFECVYGLNNMKLQIQSGRSFHSSQMILPRTFSANHVSSAVSCHFRNLCDPPPVLHIQCQGSAHQNQPSRIFLPHHHHHQCRLSEGVSCSTPRTSRWSLTAKDFNTHIVHTAINLYVHS